MLSVLAFEYPVEDCLAQFGWRASAKLLRHSLGTSGRWCGKRPLLVVCAEVTVGCRGVNVLVWG